MKSIEKVEGQKTKGEPATDCFAYDYASGECACLSVKGCPGRKCAFYKGMGQAMEEIISSPLAEAYLRCAQNVMDMMEEKRASQLGQAHQMEA